MQAKLRESEGALQAAEREIGRLRDEKEAAALSAKAMEEATKRAEWRATEAEVATVSAFELAACLPD